MSARRQQLEVAIGAQRYRIDVGLVDSVIPWRTPVPIPWPCPLLGLALDRERDRVVPVCDVAELALDDHALDDSRRIVVCTTSEGLLGIPVAGVATHVETDTEVPVLDPEALIAALRPAAPS